jgi:hypothetical protein
MGITWGPAGGGGGGGGGVGFSASGFRLAPPKVKVVTPPVTSRTQMHCANVLVSCSTSLTCTTSSNQWIACGSAVEGWEGLGGPMVSVRGLASHGCSVRRRSPPAAHRSSPWAG